MHKALPSTPHWYLGVLATHPGHRGRQLGRATLDAGLRRAAEDGLPAYLETSNPDNLRLYRAAGFEVVDTLTVDTLTVDTLPVWVMATRP